MLNRHCLRVSKGLFAFLIFSSAFSQGEKIETLKKDLASANDPASELVILLDLSYAFEDISLDSMMVYANRAKLMADKLENKDLLAESDLCIGISQWRKGQLSLGKETIEKVVSYSQASENKSLEANALHQKGRIHNYQGQYSEALEANQTALTIAENLKDSTLIPKVLRSIGGIHYNIRDFESAEEYWKKGLELAIRSENYIAAASLLNNIGAIHKDNNNSIEAIKYFKMALKMHPSNSCQQIYSILNIAETYASINNSDSAILYFNKAQLISKRCDDFVINIATSVGIANVNRKKGDYASAIEVLLETLSLTESKEHLREKSILLFNISGTYEEMDNTDLALDYFKQYSLLEDSIISDETSKKIVEIESQNQLNKIQNDQRIALLAKEKQIIIQRLLTIIFVVGFVSMIFLAWIYYRNFKRNKESNIALTALNSEIENQKSVLKSQADELQTLNNQLEVKVNERTEELKAKYIELKSKNEKLSEYAFINSHLLRAPLSKIMAISELLSRGDYEIDRELNEALISSSKELDDIIHEIAQLVSDEELTRRD